MRFNLNKIRGFTLIEVSIVVLILTLFTAFKLKEEARELRLSIGKAQGQHLKVLKDGLYSFGLKHFNAIINNTAIPGVAITRAPTVAELRALGFLNAGFSATGYYGANYLTSITPSPAACVAPNCNIQGLVYMNLPVIDPMSGNVDGPALGEAVRQIGADGGASIRTPGTISGLFGGWSVINPLGATRGILAARVGAGSELDFTAYLRRDGTLPMTGNLDLGGNSVTSLAVSVEGAACATAGELTIDASGSVLTCQGGVRARQGSRFWKEAVTNVASLPMCTASTAGETRLVTTPSVGTGARAYSCDGVAWSAIAVDDNGNLVVDGTLTADNVVAGHRNLARTIEDAVVVTNGSTLSKPDCAVGRTPQIFLFPSSFSIGATAKPIQAVEAYAVDNGSNWTANLRVLVDTGWQTPSGSYGQMIAFLKCY